MFSIRRSLTTKLTLGMLLLSMAIFVMSVGFLYHHSRRIIKEEAVERANGIINNAAERVARHLTSVETATDNIEWLITDNLQSDSLLAFTRRVVELSPDINGCSITTEPGVLPQYGRYFSAYTVRLADTMTTVREAEYEYFDKVWYKVPSTLRQPCWVDPFDDYNEGTLSADEMIASYCKPLNAPDGTFIGVIATDLALSRLAQAIQGEKPYRHSFFIMLGEKGHYFIHPDTAKLFHHTIFSCHEPKEHPDINALGMEMTSGRQGSMEVNAYGQTCLVCYRPLPGTPWSVALVSPESDVFHSYHRLKYIVVPLIIIAFFLILFYCYKVGAHAARPLKRLAEQTKKIAAGNYHVKIDPSTRPDDVGRLQNSFAAMQTSLARHMEHINQVNAITAKRNEEQTHANALVEESVRQKTDFIRNVTHQIRTPLNIILGFTTVLRDNGKQLPAEERVTVTKLIERNTVTITRMAHMLFDSSDAAKVNMDRNSYVACNDIARKGIFDTERQFPGIRIVFRTELPEKFYIHTNRLYLFRIIREILYNSAKYSNGQNISLQLTQTRSTVRYVFEDTGPGIKAEDRERLFTPFNKTSDLTEGLGLGLSLTLRHARELGGNFTLDTSYQQGCRIIVELPKD